MPKPLTVVFIHGWSVTHTDTYGKLPEELAAAASKAGLALKTRDLWLSRYISFRDEVRMEDLSRAMDAAVRRELKGQRFVAITHSTGGPVARHWWHRFYASRERSGRCPMTHLVMLAPANFGSALSQLGKSRVGRLKSWFGGVEPGQGVLDWLELGSPESWELNTAWLRGEFGDLSARNVLPFVLTGQTIDRKLYDNLNSYTGESGSDGVVRVASANLNANYVKLIQQKPRAEAKNSARYEAPRLQLRNTPLDAPRTAFRILAGASHSGDDRGIMRSAGSGTEKGLRRDDVVDTIVRCLQVTGKPDYDDLCDAFRAETEAVQAEERVEVEDRFVLRKRYFIHDRTNMLIFRVTDTEGHAITDFDLVLTGADDDPNHLPHGFFRDRQANSRSRNTVTYFIDHDIMVGCLPVVYDNEEIRGTRPGIARLGLYIHPRPTEGFVHYLPCHIKASKRLFEAVVQPNQSTLIDIVLRRVVRDGTLQLSRSLKRRSFKRTDPGDPIG